MTLVDTSIWIDFFNGKNEKLKLSLNRLIDEDSVFINDIIYLEIINGCKLHDTNKVKRLFGALLKIEIEKNNFNIIEKWIQDPKIKPYRFGVCDLIIASCAAQHNLKIWSLDKDFLKMYQLKMIEIF
jgi:predicted nucleic acid-binding protein